MKGIKIMSKLNLPPTREDLLNPDKYAQTREEHECCQDLKDGTIIAIAKREYKGETNWWWTFYDKTEKVRPQSHGISFCPYCGEKLE